MKRVKRWLLGQREVAATKMSFLNAAGAEGNSRAARFGKTAMLFGMPSSRCFARRRRSSLPGCCAS